MFDRDAEPPTDADLEAAFTVADENRSGNVDVFEFIRLFQLIKTGKVCASFGHLPACCTACARAVLCSLETG